MDWNTTTTDYSAAPLTVAIGGISATIHAAPGTESVAVTGLSVSISSFVTITGNFGFQENAGGIEAAANSVTALLSAGPASVGVTGGTLALLLNNDGTKVLEASGALQFSAAGFASASATSVLVDWNTTATDYSAAPLTVTIGGVSGTIHAAPNTQSVAVTGLSVSISSFVTITGNFGFQENAGGIEAAANQETALLNAGPASVGVTGGTLALLLNNDGTKVLEASGALQFSAAGFASASATSVLVDWNTTTTDYSAAPLTVTIGGISAMIHAAPGTESVAVTGLSVSISSFVTITGNFGFQENLGGIEAAANQVTALLSAGPASVGVTGGTLALLLNNDGTKVLEASGALQFSAAGFASASATSVLVDWNTTTTDYSAAPLTVTIGGISATIHAAPNTQSVAVTGLSVSISSFVAITGNFGFEENSGGIEAAANSVTALLSAGPASVGVTGGTLALLLNSDGTKVLEASGALQFSAAGFASASATKVLVDWNTTTTDYSASPLTVSIGGISAMIHAAPGTESVAVTGLSVSISSFVTITGNFGFQENSGGIEAAANQRDGPVERGSGECRGDRRDIGPAVEQRRDEGVGGVRRAAVQRGGFRQRERDERAGGLEHDDDGLRRGSADGDHRGDQRDDHARRTRRAWR